MKLSRLSAGLLLLLIPWAAWSGQKKQRHEPPLRPPELPLSSEQEINRRISEMLGAWQIGDANLLHKYYADDVTVVSGLDEPLLTGWPSYLAAYQRQEARTRQAQIIRRNTYVKVQDNLAWAAYQWQFGGLVDGKPADIRGHTTLIFERRGGVWLIVHNHTSVVAAAQLQPPPAPAASRPNP